MRHPRTFGFLLLTFLICSLYATAQQGPRNYLYTAWSEADGETAFRNMSWREKQRSHILEVIQQLPAITRQSMLREADQAMAFTWPALPASLYLQFRDNGNRVNFENAQFERRKVLSTLVAGELADGSGKYIPQIANGLWAILEESTWVLPAHIGVQKAGSGLADPAEQIVDLFAGETAATISWAQFLVGRQLDRYSPMINKRINYELNRRIIAPFLDRTDFWWMGFNGRPMNNWNIWINTNVLQTALLAVNDTDIRSRVIEKAVRSADFFLNGYPEDGGCDEGPSYWGHAGGKLIEFVNWLRWASGGRADLTKNELIHRIGTYIYKMHIDSTRFVNFADASASVIPPPHTVLLYGELFKDPQMKAFAAYLYRLGNKDTTHINTSSLPLFIYDLESRKTLLSTAPAAPFTATNWLPDLQVLTLRSVNGSSRGLFFAAKGGHNAESHNHNDIGNFVLYVDGKPAIIDVGVGTYTKQTFSKDRYQLWYMQSQWHNCPTVNGVQQQDGRKFQAKDVVFSEKGNTQMLSMDIAAAYPEAAMVKTLKRTFTFMPADSRLKLTEAYELQYWKAPYQLHFMTCLPAHVDTPGKIVLDNDPANLQITYDASRFEATIEKQAIDDARLSPVWGDGVYRITLKARGKALQGKNNIDFEIKRRRYPW
ncbi:heparinase II/III domain-containing protein [Chitinophaga qingshengii]|uniref:Heparinase II/III family protein n=1 Tax=Chitinophaga qingshengii TaxID=1569794 RepID=A0ABR7TMK5_9BACT|nr:heparinase II/III family protein [Chitinophaga qingshengii]MBC9930644.1 heparinase II/III family protein [Chitinophaga qingshengii]